MRLGEGVARQVSEQDRSPFRTFQSHPKNLQAVLETAQEFREQLLVRSEEEKVRLIKLMLDCCRSWMLCGQKERIDELPPDDRERENFKNSVFSYSLLVNSCLQHSEGLASCATGYLLWQLGFLFEPAQAIREYKQLGLLSRWMDAIAVEGVSPLLYAIRFDQASCLLFSLLLFKPVRVNAYLAERSRQAPLRVGQLCDDSTFWAVATTILEQPPSMHQPTLLYNMLVCLVPALLPELVNPAPFPKKGPFCRLVEQVEDKLKRHKEEYLRNADLAKLERLHEDGDIFGKVMAGKMVKLALAFAAKLKLAQGFEDGLDSLYFYELK